MKDASRKIVRKAFGAGRWFPGRKSDLEKAVNECIEGATAPRVPGRIVAAVAPHAGYQYSGKVAGHAFRAIRDNARDGTAPEVVVVLGFSHSAGFEGVALMDGDAIETPIGEAALDGESARTMCSGRDRIRMNCSPHSGEHSAENQIPFVQQALPGTKLVVGLIGDHDRNTLNQLVASLAELAAGKKVLVVASSDMLHHADYDLVVRTDKATLRKMETLDYSGIMAEWGYGNQTLCGVGPVIAAMRFAEGQECSKGTVLFYRNCGDDFPESRGHWVVGYGAVVFAVAEQ